MTHPLPDSPPTLDVPLDEAPGPALDHAHVAQLLHAAHAYLATAFHLLQCHAAQEARYEAQAHIYLARKEIEQAIEWHQRAAAEG
jgi:hypothetical protein